MAMSSHEGRKITLIAGGSHPLDGAWSNMADRKVRKVRKAGGDLNSEPQSTRRCPRCGEPEFGVRRSFPEEDSTGFGVERVRRCVCGYRDETVENTKAQRDKERAAYQWLERVKHDIALQVAAIIKPKHQDDE